MKRVQLIKHLKKNGCKLIKEGSKHSLWGDPERSTRTAVPRHTEIDNILAKEICKQLKIPRL